MRDSNKRFTIFVHFRPNANSEKRVRKAAARVHGKANGCGFNFKTGECDISYGAVGVARRDELVRVFNRVPCCRVTVEERPANIHRGQFAADWRHA